MAKNTLLVITRNQDDYAEKLKTLDLPDLEIIVPKNPEEIQAHIGQANIMLANPILAKQYINDAKNVVWVQSTFAGIDAMNAESLRKDYILTNVRDVYGPPLAEYAFSYILLFRKEVLEHIAYQKEKIWQQRSQPMLGGETLCILGAGSIGTEIARIGKAFGMRVLGYRTSKKPAKHFDEVYAGDELKDFLAKGDYVIDVLPNTAATTDVINKETISAMKPTVLFMNIGRGNSVNENDLLEAMREKRIARAVLDVFKKEPLPSESPLWSAPNLYITPHLAGYVVTDEIFEIFRENYRRFRAGEELMYRVNFAKGY